MFIVFKSINGMYLCFKRHILHTCIFYTCIFVLHVALGVNIICTITVHTENCENIPSILHLVAIYVIFLSHVCQ